MPKRKQMALTGRRKRPLDRTTGHLRDTRLIVIATEGVETEPQYFRMFHNTRVQIRILPTSKDEEHPEHGFSAPKSVLKRLTQFKKEFQLGSQDELWLVIDMDRWKRKMLDDVARVCGQQDYRMAVSNPSFELWLYLHRSDIDRGKKHTAKTLEADLRRLLGSFNKLNLRDEDFIEYVDDAIMRAKGLDNAPAERWPSTLGTHVYRLVESIKKPRR